MMTRFRTFFQQFFTNAATTTPKIIPLGRWNLESCNQKTNQKIDQSNEDHCGPCGQSAVLKPMTYNYNYKKDIKFIQ